MIRGAGYGHGVGMSQYGAYGFAKRGHTFDAILRHYYTGTELQARPSADIRVLLQSVGSPSFTGASKAGTRKLNPKSVYSARRASATSVDLISARGRRIATLPAPLVVRGSGGKFVLRGRGLNGISNGRYRGSLVLTPGLFGGLTVVNKLGVESYVRGVVARESPASWPLEALKAQAVAARTYAITTARPERDFDQYPDVRSQVYTGMEAETATTDEAIAQTAGQVVTYAGEPIVTYFFSTSGGRTEDVENTPLGKEPKPYLKSVADPYDSESPKHRWTVRMTISEAQRRLGSLVKGTLRGIDVIKRGRSPRVVAADVVGTGGTTRTNGATLRARLGLNDTWAYFTVLTAGEAEPKELPEDSEPEQQAAGDPTGGTAPGGRMTRRPVVSAIAGRVFPNRHAVLQVREGRSWRSIKTVTVRRGRYRFAVQTAGLYRVKAGGAVSDVVRVRRG